MPLEGARCGQGPFPGDAARVERPRRAAAAKPGRAAGNSIGTFVGNNRTALVSRPAVPCLQGSSWAQRACRAQLRQRCSVSTPPIVCQDGAFPLGEWNALIFIRHTFRKGLWRELNCFILLLNLNLKFMARNFSWGLYTLRSLTDF